MRRALIISLLAASSLLPEQALAADTFLGGRAVADLRGRYEIVDDAGKAKGALTYTLRARLGYETGSWNGLSLQADFDQIWNIGGAYNSTRNGRTAYPTIADPGMTALNRLQLTYASDFGTKFVVGRQRLLIGNQRFVGNAGWRQHEQTFDAVSAVNTSITGLTLTYAWLYRTNRVYGPRPPAPSNTAAAATGQASIFKSDSHILDGVYAAVPGLRLEAYAFLLDLASPGYATLPAQNAATAKLSTATFGGRADYTLPIGELAGKLSGEYAHQTNYAANPLSFDLDYRLGEASLSWKGATALAGYEVLGGNGTIGFATPLATLHAFNGWADLFLSTPVNGLKDFYLKASYALPMDFADARALNLTAAWHDFKTDNLNRGIGAEWDLQAELVVDGRLSFLAKYTDYAGSGTTAGGFADKSIFWLQTAYKY